MKDFDVARARVVLKSLEETTRGAVPMLSLDGDSAQEGDSPALPTLRGVANRAGLFRYGISLAACALVSVSQEVVLFPEWVVRGQVPLAKLLLLDDPPLPSKQRGIGTVLSCLGMALCGIVIVLVVIGLITTVKMLLD